MSTENTSPATGSGTIQEAQNAFAALLGGDEPAPQDDAGAQAGAEGETHSEAEPNAETEDSGESYDEGGEAEGESEGEGESTEDEHHEPVYTVKIDGQEVEVSIDELRNGYSRTQDYTRKTQALAEQRKAAEADHEAVRGERAQYSQLLAAMQQQLQALAPQEPDWNKLYQEDPLEFVRQREVWRDRAEQLKAVQSEQARLQQVQAQEFAVQQQARLAEEAKKLADAIPEWKDAGKAKAEKAALVEYGKGLGYSDEDLKTVADHRIVSILRKAMKYDEMMSKAKSVKPTGGKIGTSRPGSATSTPKKMSDAAQARQRLAKSGSLKDAASVFSNFID